MKLSDFTKEELDAVFKEFFGGTNVKRGDLTPTQLHQMMSSWNGTLIVARMRFAKIWKELKDSFWKGYRKK